MATRSNYLVVYDGPAVVLIKDVGPWSTFMSVTNDAEAVVEELAPRLRGRRLEYIDSEGSRDRLVVVDGKFSGFFPGGECPDLETDLDGRGKCGRVGCPFCEESK